MGSKGIKAVIIDDAGAESVWKGKDEVRKVIREFAGKLKEHPVTGEKFAMFGTVMTLLNVNGLGGLPTRNFSAGTFEDAEKIGADTLRETISKRGGLTAHSCMPGCVIQCSNKYVDEQGAPLVGSLDFETVCLLGSNIGISNLDHIARLNRLCNDIGVDTMETGVTLGVMGEAGVFTFGDFKAVQEIVEGLAAGTENGKILGSGAGAAGRTLGVSRVPVVKNQGMAAYDPRAIKGMGVTYAVSPMGADHTAGNAITLAVDHLDPAVQLEPVRDLHVNTMVLDSLGMCIFTGRVTLGDDAIIEGIIRAFYERDVTFDDLRAAAKECLLAEREFNRKAGISGDQDRLPSFMLEEKLSPHDSVFDIPSGTIKTFYRDL
jgi:aldehyde:ferredoxin oxidoreductase